jgi:hypothetical protein
LQSRCCNDPRYFRIIFLRYRLPLKVLAKKKAAASRRASRSPDLRSSNLAILTAIRRASLAFDKYVVGDCERPPE